MAARPQSLLYLVVNKGVLHRSNTRFVLSVCFHITIYVTTQLHSGYPTNNSAAAIIRKPLVGTLSWQYVRTIWGTSITSGGSPPDTLVWISDLHMERHAAVSAMFRFGWSGHKVSDKFFLRTKQNDPQFILWQFYVWPLTFMGRDIDTESWLWLSPCWLASLMKVTISSGLCIDLTDTSSHL